MYERANKEFNFWIFTPFSQRIFKIKMSSRILISCLVLSCVILGIGTYKFGRPLSDFYTDYAYTRSIELSNKRLNRLLELAGQENQSLKFQQAKIEGYENELAVKMAEFESIIQAASKLNMLSYKHEQRKDTSKITSLAQGGLEISCVGNKCQKSKEPYNRYTKLITANTMLAKAESYTETLSKIPFLSPVASHVTSHYGPRISPFSRRVKHHEGADFAMPYGSKVHATADGVVKKVGRCRTYGLYIDIAHSEKVVTRYAHLSSASVSEGEPVCAAQLIGAVGSSGNSTGPHLHYEVRVSGKTIDPLRIMNVRAW